MPVRQPLIIGHRGASAAAPENTLAAFELALADGADGVEFDVRLARDGAPVVIHDATLERTALRPGAVAALSSRELAGVGAGEWFNRRFPALAQERFARERVPTLGQIFGLLGGRAGVIYVEMKCEEESGYAALAAAVVGQVREHALAGRAVVKSFAHAAIAEVKRLAPDIRTAALFEPGWSRPFVTARHVVGAARGCGADEISLHYSLARAPVVEAARRAGLATLVWTVDDRAWAGRALSLGLRAVITNHPARLRAALDELRGASP